MKMRRTVLDACDRRRWLHPCTRSAQPAASAPADSAAYFFLLGRYHESQGESEKAVDAHKKAIALAPESAELRAELAGALRAPGSRRRGDRHGRRGAEARSEKPRSEPHLRIDLRRVRRAAPLDPPGRELAAVCAAGHRGARTRPRGRSRGARPRSHARPPLRPDGVVRQGHSAASPGRDGATQLSRSGAAARVGAGWRRSDRGRRRDPDRIAGREPPLLPRLRHARRAP